MEDDVEAVTARPLSEGIREEKNLIHTPPSRVSVEFWHVSSCTHTCACRVSSVEMVVVVVVEIVVMEEEVVVERNVPRRGMCAGRARLKKINSWVVEAMVVVEVEVMAVD